MDVNSTGQAYGCESLIINFQYCQPTFLYNTNLWARPRPAPPFHLRRPASGRHAPNPRTTRTHLRFKTTQYSNILTSSKIIGASQQLIRLHSHPHHPSPFPPQLSCGDSSLHLSTLHSTPSCNTGVLGLAQKLNAGGIWEIMSQSRIRRNDVGGIFRQIDTLARLSGIPSFYHQQRMAPTLWHKWPI